MDGGEPYGMQVALFDLYTSGHHLPYASRLRDALADQFAQDVTFVTLTETDRTTDFFDPGDLLALEGPGSKPIEQREESFNTTAERTVGAFCSGEEIRRFDVVHFLYADDILGPLWRHCPTSDDVRLVGELNGTFFHKGTVLRKPAVHALFRRALGSPLGRVVDGAVPDRTSHEALWEDLYLYRCLDDDTFDTMVVHSSEAATYLSRFGAGDTDTVDVVPYPAPEQFGTDISKRAARGQLGLGQGESVLLFFGSMRGEKGIRLFLEALERYQGPPFTVLLAGPPVAVSGTELEAIGRETHLEVVTDLGFVDRPELYFRAADAVVLPYTREFGAERSSQMFQEVCSSMRPVIVSAHGALGSATEEWNLGMTFEQDSVRSLVDALETFATDGVTYSKEGMEAYNDRHSYQQVARLLTRVYAGDGAVHERGTVA